MGSMMASPSKPQAAEVLVCSAADITFKPSTSTVALDDQLVISPDSSTYQALKTASDHLLIQKRPIAFPTETVYGLAAPALYPETVGRIFSTKGRPADNTLIVHVSSRYMLNSLLPKDYVTSPLYETLIKAFWPGPLTLLFPANPDTVPPIVTAGHSTVAIRMPSHPIARALISFTKTPLAAPSANSSGKPSPTKAEHVLHDLGEKLGLILDGGPCDVGLESTVVDGLGEDGHLRVLRPGGVTVEDLKKALAEAGISSRVLVHQKDFSDAQMEETPTTPGMKYRHYSPSVPVVLLISSPTPTSAAESFEDILGSCTMFRSEKPTSSCSVGLLLTSDSPFKPRIPQPNPEDKMSFILYNLGPRSSPQITAQRLFDGLLSLERQGVDVILIEGVEEVNEGLAVMNRVRKAAGEVRWVR